ncbi:hypothetical protein Tco_0002335 [Tanacetum coccineum]
MYSLIPRSPYGSAKLTILKEIILNRDTPIPTITVEVVEQVISPISAELRVIRRNELKARGNLLMALPDKYQLKFNIQKDAKSLMEAIEKSSEDLDQIHDRLQKLISQLEVHIESVAPLQDQVSLSARAKLVSVLEEVATKFKSYHNLFFLTIFQQDRTLVLRMKMLYEVSCIAVIFPLSEDHLRTTRISIPPIEPNLAERARISAINHDDYQLDSLTLPPSPSSPFTMIAYQRMIAETDPTQREEALTGTGQNSVPVPEITLTLCTTCLRGQFHTILEDMDHYPNACLEELEAFMTLWDVMPRVEESSLETLSVDELITRLRKMCEDAEDHAGNAQEEA